MLLICEELAGFDIILIEVLFSDARLHAQLLAKHAVVHCAAAGAAMMLLRIRKTLVLENHCIRQCLHWLVRLVHHRLQLYPLSHWGIRLFDVYRGYFLTVYRYICGQIIIAVLV